MEVVNFPAFSLAANKPLQQQIHSQLVDWISTGRLGPGMRMPASRKLSDQLGVSRNTITAVLEQLKAEGFVESFIGRGCFICSDLPVNQLETQTQALQTKALQPGLSEFAMALAGQRARHHNPSLPFTPGVPDLKNFPMAIWQKLQRRHQDRMSLMGYDHDQGYLALRKSLAIYLKGSRGVRCEPEQILITQGAQQALSLCSQLLLDEGDAVLHETPGYMGASSAFLVSNPNVIQVPLQNHVIDVDWIIERSDITSSAKMLYTSPTHQYPMGGLLSAGQRLALLNWSQDQKVWIIEDDYDSEFHFLHKPISAMQGMTSHNNVLYMGSFSKTLFPSLRLGYLVLPPELVGPFTAAKSFTTGESPLVDQAVIADFIDEGHFVRHLRKMRQNYRQKWQHFESLIHRHLSERVTTISESAGMHLVLDIPEVDDVQLKGRLAEQGYGSSALSSYYLGKPERTGLVLGFANTSAIERESLVLLLKTLI